MPGSYLRPTDMSEGYLRPTHMSVYYLIDRSISYGSDIFPWSRWVDARTGRGSRENP